MMRNASEIITNLNSELDLRNNRARDVSLHTSRPDLMWLVRDNPCY